MDTLFAHTPDGEDKPWQTLSEHLGNVAEEASEFAAEFGFGKWGYAIGLLHDAGKVDPKFQRRLVDAHAPSFDHAALGAAIAQSDYVGQLGKTDGNLMAFAIAGHHGGMPNGVQADERAGGKTPLKTRLTGTDFNEAATTYRRVIAAADLSLPSAGELEHTFLEKDLSGLAAPPSQRMQSHAIFSTSVLARMLYSCLVDADYLDTERYVTPELADARTPSGRATLQQLADRLDGYMRELASKAPASRVNDGRALVLEDCRMAAQLPGGLYKLTVPTGGGKTLASLSFALHHAVKNNMNRVIYAIPFTSIVEQTAGVFRKALGVDGQEDQLNILEHHSNYDFDAVDSERGRRERLAIQNWDAPVIVTTNVQLLESLYSNKPSRCRKLHNIANSVIVLDEAQTLPNQLLTASLAMLEELTKDYGVSVVLCTATQPEADSLWPFGTVPYEIVRNPSGLTKYFTNRSAFEVQGTVEEETLARQLAGLKQVLCIVDTKAKARDLYRDVVTCCREDGTLAGGAPHEEGVFHLSANMTPYHRSLWIGEIRRRLRDGERCVVISTQLIEAGVDVDFPVVWRESAGLDSLVQAAGRCNREGKQADAGVVHVFDFADDTSSETFRRMSLGANWLQYTAAITRGLIDKHGGALSADMVGEYFQELYAEEGPLGLDVKELYSSLCNTDHPASEFLTLDFETYAEKYQIIDKGETPVFVPWGPEGQKLRHELTEFCAAGNPPAAMARKLQRFSVGVPRWKLNKYLAEGLVDEKTYEPIHVLLQEENREKQYDDEEGLLEVGEGVPDVLVC